MLIEWTTEKERHGGLSPTLLLLFFHPLPKPQENGMCAWFELESGSHCSLQALGPVQTGPRRLAVPVQMLPSDACITSSLSLPEKPDTYEVELSVHFVSVCILTLGKKVFRNCGARWFWWGLRNSATPLGLGSTLFCPANLHPSTCPLIFSCLFAN